jgi:O-antigen ligase
VPISSFIIYLIVATIPILFGAVKTWVWSFYSALIVVAFLLFLWQKSAFRVWLPGKAFTLTVAFFFLITLFQCLPLPRNVLSLLSPIRYQMLAQAAAILDCPLTPQGLSFLPSASLSWWAFLLSLLLLFFVLRECITSPKDMRIVVWIIFTLATLQALYGLMQTLFPSLGVLWVDYVEAYKGDARGTFINRNHFDGFMEMVWPLALGLILGLGQHHARGNQGTNSQRIDFRLMLASDRFHLQLLLSLGLVLIILSLLFSRSRGGIAASFIGFFTFLLLTRMGNKRLPVGFWVMTGAIACLIVIYGVMMDFTPIIDRFLRVSSGDSRFDFWRDSLAIIKDHPLGIGLGNFELVFPVYNVSTASDLTVDHAHNDYLQLLVEAGIPSFLAIFTGFILFMGRSFSKVKRLSYRLDPLRFFLGIGALSGLVSIASHSFFDFNLQIPANCVYFITLITLVYVCLWQSPSGLSQGSQRHRDTAGNQ